MKILFLSRVHPPIIGGLENQSYNLIKNFKKINRETFVIKNPYGKKVLPFFIPYSFFKALYLIWKNKIEFLHLSDGVLALEGSWIKKITGIKTVITIHGLDITYNNKFYQAITPKAINKLDKIICISNSTKEECIKKGISKEKITVIPNGINPSEFLLEESKVKSIKNLEEKYNLNLKNKKVLVTIGRLIKRKGVEWFVRNVMPKLSKNYVYLVVGDGPKKGAIQKTITESNQKNRVFMLGRVDNINLKRLYNISNIFIMPNIHIEGDMEGFGIVAIEAGSCGLLVIASNIEGISDAVINGKTGWLVKEKDVDSFIEKIKAKPIPRNQVRKEVIKNFDWNKIVNKYRLVIGE